MLPRKVFFDNMFEEFDKDNSMKCDIYEKNNVINIEMDIPGFDKKDINVDIHKGTLTITAEKHEEENETDDKKYLRRERSYYGKYQRSFYLGDVLEDNVEAEFTGGTLKIRVPKVNVENTKKQIEIK